MDPFKDLNKLYFFARVVEFGSYTAAAEALGLSFVDAVSKPVELIHSPCLSTEDLFTLRRAAVRGVGVACLPTLLIADDLSSGALVRLLPSLSTRAGVLHAVFPSRRGMVPAVRALLESLSDGLAAHPLLGGEAHNGAQS